MSLSTLRQPMEQRMRTVNDAITPFTLAVPQADLEDPRIAGAWITLMRRLGYTRWVAQGRDWGSVVTTAIGVMKPDDCAAIHVNMPLVFPEPDQLQDMDPFEQAAVASLAHWEKKGSGYFKQQSIVAARVPKCSLGDRPVDCSVRRNQVSRLLRVIALLDR
jgi:pimeloyl-ACP methyl ester carboxylesterase